MLCSLLSCMKCNNQLSKFHWYHPPSEVLWLQEDWIFTSLFECNVSNCNFCDVTWWPQSKVSPHSGNETASLCSHNCESGVTWVSPSVRWAVIRPTSSWWWIAPCCNPQPNWTNYMRRIHTWVCVLCVRCLRLDVLIRPNGIILLIGIKNSR